MKRTVKRESGVLLSVSSLPGKYGCGSFGAGARMFIDFLYEAGFTYWQVLPFAWPDVCGSPYKSVSAFAGNPFYIDLDVWLEKGLVTAEELAPFVEASPYGCDYAALQARLPLFLTVSRRVQEREAVNAYIAAHPHLDAFCHFMAKKEASGQKPFWDWAKEVAEDPDILFMHRFLQYEFFLQWAKIKKYANEKGIRILGDMPIYVDADSADVYAAPENFQLDARFRPSVVAGVPPDYFSPDGQLWGNPIYDWEAMKEDRYRWWQERMAHTMSVYDAVRIDHFRAFSSYYAVAADAKDAKSGQWHPGPGLPFVRMLKKAAGKGEIIAEDLGDVDEDVKRLVRDSGLPGMRVFQFGFDGADDYHRPHAYPENSVAYSGTHDNNTLLGFLWESSDEKRSRMMAYCGHDPSRWTSGLSSLIDSIFRSHARLVILPLQDILGFGADTRMNTPGRSEGSWTFRVSAEQLAGIDRSYWRGKNDLFSRMREDKK